MHQYQESGMANVWLRNGYDSLASTADTAVQVRNGADLNRVIARCLMQSEAALSGRGLRFLRLQLALSREQWGEIIGVGAETIIQWEQEVTVMPVAADFMARVVYASRIDPSVSAVTLLEQMARVKRGKRHQIMCHLEEGVWVAHEA